MGYMAKPSLEYTTALRIVGVEPEAGPGMRPDQDGVYCKALSRVHYSALGLLEWSLRLPLV